jgi:hypothetical protein
MKQYDYSLLYMFRPIYFFDNGNTQPVLNNQNTGISSMSQMKELKKIAIVHPNAIPNKKGCSDTRTALARLDKRLKQCRIQNKKGD